ncbi:Fc.00g089850.m01.CDS01 [Cosmosporella sp. VM-42]
MSSATNTPQFGPSSPFNLIPSSPSPLGNPPLVPMDDIPPLSLEVLDNHRDKVESLHLIADSIAQMRQRASLTLVFHPICLAGLSAALATVYQLGYVSKSDVGMAITVSCGVVMTYLMGIRYYASGYITLAEQLKWGWLQSEEGEEDTVLGARYDDELIGTLVLRLESNPILPAGKKKKGSISSLRAGKGIIRAWTTLLKYRGKGVGKDLLYEAVRVTKDRCGKDAEVGFAKEHANSTMLLPNVFNAPFRRDEVRATRALEEVLADWEVAKKRR